MKASLTVSLRGFRRANRMDLTTEKRMVPWRGGMKAPLTVSLRGLQRANRMEGPTKEWTVLQMEPMKVS